MITTDLEDALSKRVSDLEQQLAKANERIAELESYNVRLANESHEYQQRCTELEKDLLRQSVFMEMTAEKLEQHREWQATAKVLRRPTREARKALNKFAIEKKIEAIDDLLEEIQCSVVVPKRYEQFQEPYLEGIKHCIQFIECQSEQLRKEQE